jgi:ArsR family transcriptional regulator
MFVKQLLANIFKNMTALLKAISNDTRRRILEILKTGERPVWGISRCFTFSDATISTHLKVLREAQLVVLRKDGLSHFYSLNKEKIALLNLWFVQFNKP